MDEAAHALDPRRHAATSFNDRAFSKEEVLEMLDLAIDKARNPGSVVP
jgi:hypothetical protein